MNFITHKILSAQRTSKSITAFNNKVHPMVIDKQPSSKQKIFEKLTNPDLERQVKELESKEIFNSDQIKIIRFLLREDFQPWSGRLRQFLIKIRPLLDDPIFVEAFKKSEIRRTLFEDIKVINTRFGDLYEYCHIYNCCKGENQEPMAEVFMYPVMALADEHWEKNWPIVACLTQPVRYPVAAVLLIPALTLDITLTLIACCSFPLIKDVLPTQYINSFLSTGDVSTVYNKFAEADEVCHPYAEAKHQLKQQQEERYRREVSGPAEASLRELNEREERAAGPCPTYIPAGEHAGGAYGWVRDRGSGWRWGFAE